MSTKRTANRIAAALGLTVTDVTEGDGTTEGDITFAEFPGVAVQAGTDHKLVYFVHKGTTHRYDSRTKYADLKGDLEKAKSALKALQKPTKKAKKIDCARDMFEKSASTVSRAALVKSFMNTLAMTKTTAQSYYTFLKKEMASAPDV